MRSKKRRAFVWAGLLAAFCITTGCTNSSSVPELNKTESGELMGGESMTEETNVVSEMNDDSESDNNIYPTDVDVSTIIADDYLYNAEQNTEDNTPPSLSAEEKESIEKEKEILEGNEKQTAVREGIELNENTSFVAPPSTPVDANGNVYMGHGQTTPEDKYGELTDGLNKACLYNNNEVKTLIFDNVQMTVGYFTLNQFIDNAAHEWHIYTAGGQLVSELAPGEKGFCHIDSDYFSSAENKKTGTTEKNGQIVFYMRNDTDITQNIADCTVYKLYISFAYHGITDYNELPVLDYYGLTWGASGSVITDKNLFGEYRSFGTPDDSDDSITRYRFGALEETAVWLDVLKSSDVFCGITIIAL